MSEQQGQRVNWKNFWRMWGIGFQRCLWIIRTPWFAACLSSGSPELITHQDWYGFRVYYGHVKNWDVKEGCLIFTHRDESLSWNPKQRIATQLQIEEWRESR